MKIPHAQLDKELLRSVVEDYVTREGTDYGEQEYSLETKVEQVIRQLEQGGAVINYDADSETVSIVPVE